MLGIIRLVAIAALILFILAHRGAYQTIVALPAEQPDEDVRTTYVSVGGTGPQVVLTCPVGIDFSAPGTIGIIDHDMRRIVSVDTRTRDVTAVQKINLDRRILIKAALFDQGRLWTWLQDTTGRAYAIVDLAPFGGDSFDLPGRADLPSLGAPGPELARRFVNLGLNPAYYSTSNAAASRFAPQPASRPSTWSDQVTSPSGQVFELSYERASGNEIAITVRNTSTGSARNIRVRDFYRVVSADAVKATAAGEVFVAVTSEARSSKVLVHETIVRIPPGGAKPVAYDMPLARTDCVPPQDYAVSDAGEVYFLQVNERQVSLLQIKPRNFLSDLGRRIDAFEGFEIDWPRRDLDPDLRAGAFASAQSGFVTVRRGQKISRGDVVRNACAYVNKTWTLSGQSLSPYIDPPPAAYLPSRVKICRDETASMDLSRTCRGCVENREGARWRQSKDLTSNHVGLTITGLPYSWGGADTLEAFDKKVAARRPAGQTCTKGGADVIKDSASPPNDPDEIFTMGVDCSGFVTRALGFIANDTEGAFHLDTGTLASISEKVKFDMCDEGAPCLQPGDIFVKSGKHVRMHFEWTAMLPGPGGGGQRPSLAAMITESIPDFGVVRQPLLLKEFQGYKRGRMRRVEEPAPAPAASWTARDLLCVP